MRWILLVALLCMALPVGAQDAPVVTIDNVTTLAPSAQIDFDNLPEEVGEVLSGGFALDAGGQRLAIRNRDNAVAIFTTTGELVDVFSIPGADGLPDTVLDSSFNRAGTMLASIVSDGATYTTAIRLVDEELTALQPFPFAPDIPLRVWFDAEAPYYWLEVTPADPGESAYLVRLPYVLPGIAAVDVEPLVVPFAPDSEPDTFARFGRINAPYAVTATQAGGVTVWNLEQGEAIARAQVDGLPVFGGLNRDASALAWRDPSYTELHLLNLTTGEDRLVAPLDGTYINYILVTPPADVILGVHVGEEAIIAAWNAETGERTDLGAYRECSRTPDMARLSGSATVLVIGCDTGIDIWRVDAAE
jgi:hypothetical protein